MNLRTISSRYIQQMIVLGRLTCKTSSTNFRQNRLYNVQSNILCRNQPANVNKFVRINCTNIRQISTTKPLSRTEENAPALINLLTENNFVIKVQELLIKLHEYTGLSWFGTIIVAGFTVRTVLVLPLTIFQHHVNAKLELVQKELDTTSKAEITKYVNDMSKQHNWNSEKMRKAYDNMMFRRRKDLYIEHNCHPSKTSVVILIQAPVWITLSSALRSLIQIQPTSSLEHHMTILEMKSSSFLWLSDLTVPDATWTLPCFIVISNLIIVQINYMVRKHNRGGMVKFLTFLIRSFTILLGYYATTVPSCISLYWATSSLFGLCQNMLLWTPSVRKLLRIPVTDSVRKHPLGHIWKKLKQFYYFFK